MAAKTTRGRRRARGVAVSGKGVTPVKKVVPGADNSHGPTSAGFAIEELRRLIRLVQRTGIGELEVSSGGRTVRIAAQGSASPGAAAAPAMAPVAATPPAVASRTAGATPSDDDRLQAVTSPMVGTFYRAPAPDADPYVELGTPVDVGQTVCIIEAMKLMNEIESEVKGRVVRILVENAQPVEFGQKLFLIEPA